MNKNESKYFNTAHLMNIALIELLNQKDVEYITVKEICEKAGVNRSTFYLHYENIYELVNETLDNITKEFISKFNHINPNAFIKNINSYSINELNLINSKYLIPYLEFIKENKNIFIAYFNNPNGMKTIEKIESLKQYILLPIMTRFEIPKNDIKYWMAFGIKGISAIIEEWIKDDCNDTIEHIQKIIIDCIRPKSKCYEEKDET